MTTSPAGMALIESFEQLRLQAYWDGTYLDKAKTQKRWSIGWGTTRYPTGSLVQEGDICAVEQADEWLEFGLSAAERAVQISVKVPITQNQFDSLCSFAYNVGIGNSAVNGDGFEGSTLLKLLNSGNPTLAALQFPLWDHDNGQVSAGLLRRRMAEQALFVSAGTPVT